MMKVANKTRRKRLFIAILVAILVVAILAVFYKLLSPEQSTQNPPSQTQLTETETRSAEPELKLIELPGTKAFPTIDGQYTDDDHIWRLVNKSHPFHDLHYRPVNLQVATVPSRTDKTNDERSIRADIMPEVEKMFADAKQAGFELQIGSGWRSYEQQNIYYSNYSRLYGQESADTFSAKPGFSEHQTGLVMDLATVDHVCYLEECFGETGAGQWLAKNSLEYGFILRYPRGKDGITDFIYEPWHFRYVGKDLAKALIESGLTLDEAEPYLAKAQSTD